MKDLIHKSTISYTLHNEIKEEVLIEDEKNRISKIASGKIGKIIFGLQGACERIHSTPIPFGYALHLKRILLIYMLTLPFGFIESLNWWSVPVVMVVFYTMIGIELIAEEIEDPFGTDVNDLPFDELEGKIRANIEEIKNS